MEHKGRQMNLKPKILLVEDSQFFMTIEKQFLAKTPAILLEAVNSQQVLDICREQSPQLIYMAVELRGESGIECCRKLKADPHLNEIPVVLVCSDKVPGLADLAGQAGCDAVLTKPLDRRRFLEIGRSFLAGVREHRRICRLPVRFELDDRTIAAKVLDISSGGVFIDCSEAIIPGTPLSIDLQLSRPGEQGPSIKCGGVVAWLNTRDNPFKPHHPVGFGIRFTDVPFQAGAVLNGFLKVLDR